MLAGRGTNDVAGVIGEKVSQGETSQVFEGEVYEDILHHHHPGRILVVFSSYDVLGLHKLS